MYSTLASMRPVGVGEDDLEVLADLDLLGVELADAPPHPEMVEGRDRHQLVLDVVVIPRDDRPLDHDPVGTRPQDHPRLLHAILGLGVLDLLLGQAVDEQLVLGQLHLEPALGLVVLDLDQLLAGSVFSLASGVL